MSSSVACTEEIRAGKIALSTQAKFEEDAQKSNIEVKEVKKESRACESVQRSGSAQPRE
jgi:hypothetical protein